LTRRLREAVELVDVRLLDHFVIDEGEVISFAERGWL
jgi:DNA repair protein RadC